MCCCQLKIAQMLIFKRLSLLLKQYASIWICSQQQMSRLSSKTCTVFGESWNLFKSFSKDCAGYWRDLRHTHTHTHKCTNTHTHTRCISPSPVQDWDSLKIRGSQTLPPQLKAILLKVIAQEFTIRQQEKKGAI